MQSNSFELTPEEYEEKYKQYQYEELQRRIKSDEFRERCRKKYNPLNLPLQKGFLFSWILLDTIEETYKEQLIYNEKNSTS